MGNKCLNQPPLTPTPKGQELLILTHHIQAASVISWEGKKKGLFKKHDWEDGEDDGEGGGGGGRERRKKTNKGDLESTPLLTWATAAAGQRKTAQL